MNLDKLYPGLIVASHRKMCELLGEKYIKSTTSIKSKEKKWALFFAFHKVKRSYVIDEVYESPRKAPLSPKDKYSKDILNCISYRLRYLGTDIHLFSNIELLKCCGFVNRNWGQEAPLKEYSRKHGYGPKEAEFHFSVLQKRVEEFGKNDHLKKSLNRLAEKGYIDYSQKPLVRIMPGNEERAATEKEVEVYEKVKAEFLKQNEISYIGNPYFKRFEDALRENLKIDGFGGFRFAYLIKLIPDEGEPRDWDTLSNNAVESFVSINERCIERISKTIPKDVDKSTANYLRLYTDPYNPTAITLAPKKSRTERILDRESLLYAFVKVSYDDIHGENRDSYIWRKDEREPPEP